MTNTPIEMSEDEFDDQYPLLTNHLNPLATWAFGNGPGCLFETYGEELEFVRQQDPCTIWTLVDGDHGDQYVVSGFHFVNRIGYLVSTVPVPEGVDIEVRIPIQTEPSDESGEHEAVMIQPEQLLTDIAREHLDIRTLKPRMSDALDFHEVAVWQVNTALTAAFNAGVKSAGNNAEPDGALRELPVPAPMPTPLLVPGGTLLVPGKMYLRLYHGRADPEQQMDDWGFAGPTFGPLSSYVHTYCCTFRIHGECGITEIWLEKHDDMIQWSGCFYGDMEVFIAGDNDKA